MSHRNRPSPMESTGWVVRTEYDTGCFLPGDRDAHPRACPKSGQFDARLAIASHCERDLEIQRWCRGEGRGRSWANASWTRRWPPRKIRWRPRGIRRKSSHERPAPGRCAGVLLANGFRVRYRDSLRRSGHVRSTQGDSTVPVPVLIVTLTAVMIGRIEIGGVITARPMLSVWMASR